jgi:nitrate/nitrite transporter NarK
MRIGYPTAAAAVPWIANTFGWRAVPYTLGGPMAIFAMIWHFCAAESPDKPNASKAPAAVEAARGADTPGTVSHGP